MQVEEHDRSQSYAAFNFSQYLATCHDTCLAAVVEVPSSAWVILLLGLGPLRGFLQIMNTPIKVCRAVCKPMTISVSGTIQYSTAYACRVVHSSAVSSARL